MVYIIENPEKFRSNVLIKLKENFGTLINDENESFYINLEKGIYNYAIKEANSKKIIKKWDNIYFAQLYIDRLRSIFINLKNPLFQELIKTDELTPQTIAFMTHQEMNPERWRVLINNKMIRDASKYVTNIAASTDMYTCKKCKSKKCTYYELQTRSADEPATIFVTCLDCGKHWKG